jgi:hypothetical protein
LRRLRFFLDADRAQYVAGHGKSGANHMNLQLIKMEANVNGFAEGIALDINAADCARPWHYDCRADDSA